ncbi:hypothetical protein C8R46DRAFT_179572 [Mycena filopes]|nr:hypothetical protein C8R46DRAFT_179572 [Mycena filopes]
MDLACKHRASFRTTTTVPLPRRPRSLSFHANAPPPPLNCDNASAVYFAVDVKHHVALVSPPMPCPQLQRYGSSTHGIEYIQTTQCLWAAPVDVDAQVVVAAVCRRGCLACVTASGSRCRILDLFPKPYPSFFREGAHVRFRSELRVQRQSQPDKPNGSRLLDLFSPSFGRFSYVMCRVEHRRRSDCLCSFSHVLLLLNYIPLFRYTHATTPRTCLTCQPVPDSPA